MSQAFDPVPETEPIQTSGNSTGCYIYGCLGVVAFMILLALCSGFGLFYFVTGQVEKYTSTEPTQLPSVEYDEQQLAELNARIESFRALVQDDEESETGASEGEKKDDSESPSEGDDAAAEPNSEEDETATPDSETPEDAPRELVLTADDINALVNEEEAMRGRVFFTIKDDEITGEISVPTEKFLPGSKGRYFNASATFEVTLDEGVLIVTLTEAEVKGEQVPEAFMQEVRKENLAKDLYKDKKNARMIRKFESISVEDDKIIAKLRQD